MTFVRKNIAVLGAAVVLLSAAVFVYACTRGGESAEAQVNLQHDCILSPLSAQNPRVMRAEGTITNLRNEDQTVRLRMVAFSSEPNDPDITRDYPITLGPRATEEFSHLIVNADSISNNIEVNDSYSCLIVINP